MVEENDSIGPIGAVGTNDYAAAHDGAAAAPSDLPDESAAREPEPVRRPSEQQIQAAVEQVNDHLASIDQVLQLTVDAATGITIATIRNSKTGEVLQQVPSTDLVHLARMLESWSPGRNVLLDLIA